MAALPPNSRMVLGGYGDQKKHAPAVAFRLTKEALDAILDGHKNNISIKVQLGKNGVLTVGSQTFHIASVDAITQPTDLYKSATLQGDQRLDLTARITHKATVRRELSAGLKDRFKSLTQAAEQEKHARQSVLLDPAEIMAEKKRSKAQASRKARPTSIIPPTVTVTAPLSSPSQLQSLRKRVLQFLALSKSASDFDMIMSKTYSRKDDLLAILNSVAINVGYNKWTLKPQSYKEVDYYWRVYTTHDREQAIRNGRKAFESLKLPPDAPEWALLEPPVPSPRMVPPASYPTSTSGTSTPAVKSNESTPESAASKRKTSGRTAKGTKASASKTKTKKTNKKELSEMETDAATSTAGKTVAASQSRKASGANSSEELSGSGKKLKGADSLTGVRDHSRKRQPAGGGAAAIDSTDSTPPTRRVNKPKSNDIKPNSLEKKAYISPSSSSHSISKREIPRSVADSMSYSRQHLSPLVGELSDTGTKALSQSNRNGHTRSTSASSLSSPETAAADRKRKVDTGAKSDTTRPYKIPKRNGGQVANELKIVDNLDAVSTSSSASNSASTTPLPRVTTVAELRSLHELFAVKYAEYSALNDRIQRERPQLDELSKRLQQAPAGSAEYSRTLHKMTDLVQSLGIRQMSAKYMRLHREIERMKREIWSAHEQLFKDHPHLQHLQQQQHHQPSAA
ncbi:uncharacterized protein VTP21DRAFT_4215 [Calcarisporiella thermophila]|uniref:uncharacterized protein n=1 Tax=Calcarisporiella thermophila TaxID=911321 RepID=UPI0037443FC5